MQFVGLIATYKKLRIDANDIWIYKREPLTINNDINNDVDLSA